MGKLSRRQFLQRSLAAAIALPAIVPSSVISSPGKILPNDRITLAITGLGKQGSGLLSAFCANQQVQEVQVSIRTGFYNHPVECDLPVEKIPENLDWELWLGPAPLRPYHSTIAPPISCAGWPAWRNYRDYSGGGMTDWGAHHFDIAQWVLAMDHSGPVEICPAKDTDSKLTYHYSSGVTMTADFLDNYVMFIGTEGTIQVNRNYLKSWPENFVKQKISPDEIHLYRSDHHHYNWIECIRNRAIPICDAETGCRSVWVCHLGNLATQLKRPLHWNPDEGKFIIDQEANHLQSRSMRKPWRLC